MAISGRRNFGQPPYRQDLEVTLALELVWQWGQCWWLCCHGAQASNVELWRLRFFAAMHFLQALMFPSTSGNLGLCCFFERSKGTSRLSKLSLAFGPILVTWHFCFLFIQVSCCNGYVGSNPKAIPCKSDKKAYSLGLRCQQLLWKIAWNGLAPASSVPRGYLLSASNYIGPCWFFYWFCLYKYASLWDESTIQLARPSGLYAPYTLLGTRGCSRRYDNSTLEKNSTRNSLHYVICSSTKQSALAGYILDEQNLLAHEFKARSWYSCGFSILVRFRDEVLSGGFS